MKNNKTKPQQYRSSRSPMFLKKGARKNFANPTGLKRIEKKLQHWRSLMKSAKSPRMPLSAEHLYYYYYYYYYCYYYYYYFFI